MAKAQSLIFRGITPSTAIHWRKHPPLRRPPEKRSPSAVEKPVRKADSNKLTFKEKRELEQLEQEIPALENQKRLLEESLGSGTMNHEELFCGVQGDWGNRQAAGRKGDPLAGAERKGIKRIPQIALIYRS